MCAERFEAVLPAPVTGGVSRSRRLSLLALLYVSQAIPLGFFIEAVPAIGRDFGLTLRDVGLLQALALPFLIKFLWAPVVDGRMSPRWGHYRSWLLPLQALAVAAVVAIALLDPRRQLGWLLPLGAVFMLLAATQDIASDGLAVRILARRERGLGNGVQVGGFYLGQILGGGMMLILFSRLGWRPAMLAMALLLALPLASLATFREPPVSRPARSRIDYRALGRFFRRPGAAPWVAVLVLYRAGDAMALTMARPMLVDLGLDLAQIGLIVGLGVSVAALVGALAGGVAIERIGRKRALALFAAVHALALLGYGLPALGWSSLPILWAVSIGAALAGGMATTALYTHMMDRSSVASGGTDFTLQQSLAAAGPLAGAAASGLLAEALGYAGHFAVCAGMSAFVALLVVAGLRVVPGERRPRESG